MIGAFRVSKQCRKSPSLTWSHCCSFQLGLDGDDSLYKKHIQPLVYGIGLILPIIYTTGVIFTLKTHSSYVYDEFYEQLKDDCHGQEREYLRFYFGDYIFASVKNKQKKKNLMVANEI